jgi:hypothetical protein
MRWRCGKSLEEDLDRDAEAAISAAAFARAIRWGIS